MSKTALIDRSIDVIRQIVSQNLYVSKVIYNILGSIYKDNLLDDCVTIDSIEDVYELSKLVSYMKNGTMHNTYYNFHKKYYTNYGILNAITTYDSNGLINMTKPYYYPAYEHGIILYDYIHQDINYTSRPIALTFGEYRKNIIGKRNYAPALAIGPYIHYAKQYYSNEKINKIKERNGKTLLVFPSHTTRRDSLERDNDAFHRAIHAVSKDFSRVIICLYYWDLDDDYIKKFKAEGYEVVSAGFQYDPLFLARLKTIITLADSAIGDAIGTNVGYCIQSGLHYGYIETNINIKTNKSITKHEYDEISTHEKHIIQDLCNNESQDQHTEYLDYLFGFSKIRTKNEISQILEINRDITIAAKGNKFLYKNTTYNILNEYKNINYDKFCLLNEAMPK